MAIEKNKDYGDFGDTKPALDWRERFDEKFVGPKEYSEALKSFIAEVEKLAEERGRKQTWSNLIIFKEQIRSSLKTELVEKLEAAKKEVLELEFNDGLSTAIEIIKSATQ